MKNMTGFEAELAEIDETLKNSELNWFEKAQLKSRKIEVKNILDIPEVVIEVEDEASLIYSSFYNDDNEDWEKWEKIEDSRWIYSGDIIDFACTMYAYGDIEARSEEIEEIVKQTKVDDLFFLFEKEFSPYHLTCFVLSKRPPDYIKSLSERRDDIINKILSFSPLYEYDDDKLIEMLFELKGKEKEREAKRKELTWNFPEKLTGKEKQLLAKLDLKLLKKVMGGKK
jgi:hypothetical protein